MVEKYINCASLEEVLNILSDQNNSAKVISGGTDLVLEIEKGAHGSISTLLDISRVPGLDNIIIDADGIIHIGATVTHNQAVKSEILHQYAPLLVEACFGVGSPQIRNRGTIVGNIVTASPANDTISPLMALDAELLLKSKTSERIVMLSDFYTGVRKTILRSDEIVVEIRFNGLNSSTRSVYKKYALRKAQAISLVNASVIISIDKDKITKARITLGAVAPTIIHANKAENFLIGKNLSKEVIDQASKLVSEDVSPINDIRSSADYRTKISSILVKRGLYDLMDKKASIVPIDPVVLCGNNQPNHSRILEKVENITEIHTRINGKEINVPYKEDMNLLHLLRDEVHLTGTKEGCGEGECGACTIFMDGVAVMSCLVPAARADGSEIVTIEGLTNGEKGLHPVQKAFIENDAVQCGYCTPGFIMSAVKLFEEKNKPDIDEIKLAITGNLCRCTGYYKIVKAIESVVESE
jgi:carbon-monoxide dehydrogenase medium subunit